MELKTALVAGATGLVGSTLVKSLLQSGDYSKVTLLVRTPLSYQHPQLEQVVIDFDHLASCAAYFHVNEVYCCLGTTMKQAKTREAFRKVDFEYPVEMAQISKTGQVQKFLLVSAMGANSKSKIFYNRVKGETERAIVGLGLPAFHIFRPSLLLGNRQEFRLGERIGGVIASGITPLLVGGMRKYRPIHVETVARAMYIVAQGDQQGTHVYSSDDIATIAQP